MQIRPAKLAEVAVIYQFIQNKAEFDRSVGAYSGTVQTNISKIKNTIFGDCPYACVLFVENEQSVIGFALYCFRYSSFAGQPSIWLDDLFINPDMRNNGAGTLLMNKLQEIAHAHNCTHLAWTADARNTKGLNFYNRLGAKIIEQKGERCFLNWKLS